MRGSLRVNQHDYSEPVISRQRKNSPNTGECVQNVIEDIDVDVEIKQLDLSEFSNMESLQKKFRDVLWKHRGVFKGTGLVKGFKHRIKLQERVEPVAMPISRRSPKEEVTEQDMVEKLLKQGVLEKSESP